MQPSHVSLACNGCFTLLNICTYSASAVHVGYSVVLPHVALCHPCRVMAAAPCGLQSMHPCFPFLQRNLCAGFTLQDLEDSLADKARWQETASKSALQWNRARTCWFVTTVHAANHPGQAWRRCCSLMLLCSQTARHQFDHFSQGMGVRLGTVAGMAQRHGLTRHNHAGVMQWSMYTGGHVQLANHTAAADGCGEQRAPLHALVDNAF